MGVNIQPIEGGEILFKNLKWFENLNISMLEIQQIRLNIPVDKKFKVYIQRYNDPSWVEVPASPLDIPVYHYTVEELTDETGNFAYGSLLIKYSKNDINDSPSVKITFQ